MQTTYQKVLEFYKKNETKVDLSLFVGGFFFDVFTLADIDNLAGLIQQLAYLGILAAILYWEILRSELTCPPWPNWLEKAWQFRQAAFHFILGSLLSLYSLFFLKSASVFSTSLFVVLLALLMVVNELSWIRSQGIPVRSALFTLCLLSFFSISIPVIIGFVGFFPFFVSVLATGGCIYGLYVLLIKKALPPQKSLKLIWIPGMAICVLFLGLYLTGLIPPVPLSVENMGVYHSIEKRDGQYILSYEKQNRWSLLRQKGAKNFVARPGDKLHFFVQIFSPARFSDDVIVHWFYKDPKAGWQSTDKIPMKISGGRKEGYRGYSIKQNFQAGDWQVRAETTDGREIGRIYFEVFLDPNALPEREMDVDVY